MRYHAEKGEIILLDFETDASSRRSRLFLVLSPKAFNDALGRTWVSPISADEGEHHFHLRLPSQLETFGAVRMEEMSAVTIDERNPRFVESVPEEFLARCQAVAGRVLGF